MANLALDDCFAAQPITGRQVRASILAGRAPDGLVAVTAWIAQHEQAPYYLIHDIAAVYLDVFRETHGNGCP